MHSYYACVDLFIAPNVHIRFALDLKSASNSLFVFHRIVFLNQVRIVKVLH